MVIAQCMSGTDKDGNRIDYDMNDFIPMTVEEREVIDMQKNALATQRLKEHLMALAEAGKDR